ncbi:aspartyl/asparaginyl beta-hydroxylase-like dioxygenase [Mizugakiibacter sediminis]|uniref:Aspartyl beta-hydroxylase n=1 Tax=Mizugakiibacter sediminis TaxID=1475481 RepID=A0A0K8QPK3_9GAMM|nr:aspartyl/asparaginyl beta-hydroxylase domain-containing protein [Mizugakiibacter sediminis]GAP66626.1 aspartyl/asparaginyl beta-hydroxylase-like dioxygenase [Mizugakiibacter sediminis]
MSQSPAAVATLADLLTRARSARDQGRPQEAAEAYARIADADPAHVEALTFLGMRALAEERAEQAIGYFRRVLAQQPEDALVLTHLGTALVAADRLAEAQQALQQAIALRSDLFIARLRLGHVLERLDDAHGALVQYFRAINEAQLQGRWLSDATTHPSMREAVKRAMLFVDAERFRLFDGAIAPLRERYGAGELARVERCLRIYLQLEEPAYADPRQRPKFLYFPGLPTQPYFPTALFPWIEGFETETAAIRDEMLAVLAADSGFEPFLTFRRPEDMSGYLAGSRGTPAWNAFFFYRHGRRYDENCRRCPHTAKVLDDLPLVRIRDHAPEICFSVLTAGSHILPHRGVTNTRVVVHLPLVVPGANQCALVAGGEAHYWREGRAMAFDDTFEHEAWNRSEATRVIVLMDAWNPYLTEAERAAVAELVAAIGDFNREAGLPDLLEA